MFPKNTSISFSSYFTTVFIISTKYHNKKQQILIFLIK